MYSYYHQANINNKVCIDIATINSNFRQECVCKLKSSKHINNNVK